MPDNNDAGGVTYITPAELSRAKRADLVTLPPKIPGTNCGNCAFFMAAPEHRRADVGLCYHRQVQLPVTARMCCVFWDAPGTLRSWQRG